jgi:ubiquinone/menaquinone biosynthesis C-methylase UbiE
MSDRLQQTTHHASSTGQAYTESRFLDAHFEMCRPEYEAMLRSVGIQQGWQVFDAGCGGGSFLPLLAELVWPSGSIVALDLAPDNITAVEERLVEWLLPCPVRAEVGSVTALPYPDDSFDAVWCANTTQYLSDEDLIAALAEFRRVVRPGGLVAIKEFDGACHRMAPGDPLLMARMYDAVRTVWDGARGSLRARDLRQWLTRAGLADVWQRTTLAERWAPLRPVEQRLLADVSAGYAKRALELTLSAEDMAFWRTMLDPDAPENPVNGPDYYFCEGDVVAVGRVPA